VGVSRRMGLFVVGRLAARHGVRVRLKHAQPRGLSALVWLPDSVAQLDATPVGSPQRGAGTGAYPVPPGSGSFTTIPAPSPVAASGAHAATGHPVGSGWFRSSDGPNGNLLHRSRERVDGQHADRQAGIARRRSPGEVRSRLSEFQHGARRGHSEAPQTFGADEK
jgi:hypothetical protein